MTQLDPFIIYTVKLAMDFKSVEPSTPIPKTFDEQDNSTNPMFPDTMARIMTINALHEGGKEPELRRDNVLSLLYHADEQWVASTVELSHKRNEREFQQTLDLVHRQQRIYLDTLHLLQKAVLSTDSQKRFNEPIWFAAQVLNNNCQIRHLEYFTDIIAPLATKLVKSMEQIRLVTRRLLHKQQTLKQKQSESSSFFHAFFSNSNQSDTTFYNSHQHHDLLKRVEPHLVELLYDWTNFEKTLYECYVHTVFGKYHTNLIMEEQQKSNCTEIIQQQQQLPHELFHDEFTQLLPIVLERAINLQIMDIQSIQSLDPIAFVAVPRLTILAGVTWLTHLTGWRSNISTLPIWVKSHIETLSRITSALDALENQLLKNQTEDAHHSFVQRYQRLEQGLVTGRSILQDESDPCQQLEKQIFLDICNIADSILSSHQTQAFTVVLCHLFRHFGTQYDIEFEESEDAVPLECTILDLAI
ncbi:hypothetical protein INT47_009597 [Mucor saturninus]|uniref:Uncharacterized protein n=1 Tax=Mucor saturninus TaxID=64648 RepID=A0A8H7UWE8_9FUNG|nr:hypothetical protein INT47_009597 [Mucor saturninus]